MNTKALPSMRIYLFIMQNLLLIIITLFLSLLSGCIGDNKSELPGNKLPSVARGGSRKLSLDIEQYDDVARTDENLLELGLSRWPWDESSPYESHFIGDREWILIKGTQDDEVDAACWIGDNTILSLRMFNISESDFLAIPGYVTTRSNHQARMDA